MECRTSRQRPAGRDEQRGRVSGGGGVVSKTVAFTLESQRGLVGGGSVGGDGGGVLKCQLFCGPAGLLMW